jgi:hypothetical protein
MSILTDAVESLCDTIRDDLSEPVVYESASGSVEVLAVPSNPEELVDSVTGMLIEDARLDWTIVSDDLALGGGIAKPARGDKIRRLRVPPGVQEVYEVLPLAGQQCWSNCDPFGRIIRVHTKKMQ